MGRYCCVINCKNNDKNKEYKFYLFPSSKHKLEQRAKWIAAVKRLNPDGSLWIPNKFDVICSRHFIGNRKSEEELSPSYIPTIFPDIYKAKKVTKSAVNRFSAFINKRLLMCNKKNKTTKEKFEEKDEKIIELNNIDNDYSIDEYKATERHTKEDKACQVNFYSISSTLEKTFICNCKINNDVEIQTEIPDIVHKIIIPSQKKMKDKQCNTKIKTFVDTCIGVHLYENNINSAKGFFGFTSITDNEQMLNLAGVSLENFQFLLTIKRTNDPPNQSKVSKENRLLIFLIKMKTGMAFSAISALFDVKRPGVSRIFFLVLECLASSTSNLVFWPDKDIIQATMPHCFYPQYKDTRVIIDCTEFRIEVPASVDNKAYTYSHYKRGFTAKLLIGIAPSGFISFKSKVAGGRKSDSQLTIESGLIDLLEYGDIVLADKGFPDIRKTIDNSGKKVVVIMPPFLEKKSEFTEEETAETYNIAKVRIHVERIMQRLRIYQIFNKIPANLFTSIDKIVHVGCVLVNLQPPIISIENENNL